MIISIKDLFTQYGRNHNIKSIERILEKDK